MSNKEQIKQQLTRLSSLLQDIPFTISIAQALSSRHSSLTGQQSINFSDKKNDVFEKSFKEEKIAISLTGFYATECGIGMLIQEKGKSPLYWLRKIVSSELSSAEILLLSRFANATWKAAQPFISLGKISKDNFNVADFLNASEIKKDYDKLVAASTRLLDSFKGFETISKEQQFKRIKGLMQNEQYAFEMAAYIDASYYRMSGKEVPRFFTVDESNVMIEKSSFEEIIAINAAGFYALECGLSYLTNVDNKLPSEALQLIINDNLSENDKQLFLRLANATWKAGQPFRSLARITRPAFVPFDLLDDEEKRKDWIQIETAAINVLAQL